MKILVTGTAGFIGFHIAKKLIENGNEVIGLDNINNYYDVRLKHGRLAETGIVENEIVYGKLIKSKKHPNYKFIKINLEDKENIQNLFEFEKFDTVCHLAAQAGVRYSIENPYTYIDSNIVGFMNILECCRNNNIKHLIYASSSSVYGLNAKIPFSEDEKMDSPISLYAATKKANELMAYTYSHLYHLPTTGLRFFTVYGPWGRPDMAPMLFAKAISENKPIKVFNHGDLSRDFTYIDDIVEGTTRLINTIPYDPPFYRIFNIGNGSPVNLMTFIDTIEKTIGKKVIKNFMPIQPGDVKQTWANTQRLKAEIDYKPEIGIEEGINRFYKWYKEYNNL